MDATQVLAVLRGIRLFDEIPEQVLLLESVRALGEVKEQLRDGADDSDPCVAQTAAALARYRLFCNMLEGGDRFSSYKAGDITIARDLKAEFALERQLRQQALLDAVPILKDGGFFVSVQ